MSPKPPDDLIPHVIGSMAYVAASYEVSLDLAIDQEDSEILLDQIDAAGSHLAQVIWLLHPRWRDLGRLAAEDEALREFRRFRPDIDEDACGLETALERLEAARAAAFDGCELIDRTRRKQARYRNAGFELSCAADHLDVALYLLDPERFVEEIDATTPAQRVLLASRLEVIELQLEEHRLIVRSRAMN